MTKSRQLKQVLDILRKAAVSEIHMGTALADAVLQICEIDGMDDAVINHPAVKKMLKSDLIGDGGWESAHMDVLAQISLIGHRNFRDEVRRLSMIMNIRGGMCNLVWCYEGTDYHIDYLDRVALMHELCTDLTNEGIQHSLINTDPYSENRPCIGWETRTF